MRKISIALLLIIAGIFLNLNINLKGIVPVQATKLQKSIYTSYVTVSGEFENQDKTDIKLSYPVYIKEVFVKENQLVNRGQALFSIDIERMEAAATGSIDEETLNRLTYEDLSKLKSRSSYIDLTTLQDVIYAPDSGIISELNVYSGAAVLQNKELVSITGTDSILARFTVSQLDYGKISVGDRVDIVPVAFSDATYSGRIMDKSAVVKKQTSAVGSKVVVDVFAEIENPDKKVSGGLQINGKIQSGEPIEINTIDYRYIYQDEMGEYVYILKQGVAHKVYITTGIESETYTEIITEFPEHTVFLCGDIEEGSRVIITD